MMIYLSLGFIFGFWVGFFYSQRSLKNTFSKKTIDDAKRYHYLRPRLPQSVLLNLDLSDLDSAIDKAIAKGK